MRIVSDNAPSFVLHSCPPSAVLQLLHCSGNYQQKEIKIELPQTVTEQVKDRGSELMK